MGGWGVLSIKLGAFSLNVLCGNCPMMAFLLLGSVMVNQLVLWPYIALRRAPLTLQCVGSISNDVIWRSFREKYAGDIFIH